jgi:DNA mismatch repair protein MutL
VKISRSPILPLTPEVISMIAAGEVIERPATIIKELIENALDAQATQIIISLQDSGKKEIRISDNGFGIPMAELAIAVERHTTNKLKTTADFDQLLSYGFRGEALASIGTVSTLQLRSRPVDQTAGAEITVRFGQATDVQPVGMATGTQITVSHLFAKQPARRKFLKSANQERHAILELVTHMALTVPEVGFELQDNEQVLLHLPPQKALLERITDLFGPETADHWWPVSATTKNFSILGVVSSPQLARKTRPIQVFSLNRRLIQPSLITPAVKQSLGSSLEVRTAPMFVLFVSLSPTKIDVNVHPRKEIVQFSEEQQFLQELQTLLTDHIQVKYLAQPSKPLMVKDPGPETDLPTGTLPILHHHLKTHASPWYHALAQRGQTILQVHNTYLITETDNGLLIIDQHAAHERVLYQQFLELFEQQVAEKNSYQLPTPLLLRLTPASANLLNEHIETFTSLGFSIEPFGEYTYRISAVPTLLQEHSPQRVIETVLGDIADNIPTRGIEQLAHRTLAYLSCRSAVKAGDPLTHDQAATLLAKLQQTPLAFSCPHGRPTMHSFSWSEIEKFFHRR